MKNNYIPYPFYWDDVPIDLSFVFEKEKPAGRHGFLKVKGEDLVFEDGTEGRFWGTNFNSGLNFPSFEFSRKISKRLAKIGINIVRLHQMDSEWATPNIFQFTKGERKGNTLDLDPESMKRLDYLIYCLKQEGIYIYLDLLTYRKFKSGDGIKNTIKLDDAAKPYNNFAKKLIELQKKFNYDIWTHINPYTKLAYKDEPAIILCEVVNESDMFREGRFFFEVEPYKSELVKKYQIWREENNLAPIKGEVDFHSSDSIMMDFLRQVQENYYTEMIAHMREIGVKIPIAGTNWATNAANRRAQLVTDFADSHTYWCGWMWEEEKKKIDNRPMVGEVDNFLPELSFSRLLDRPFFASEWDEPWPNEWRAESPLFIASAGLLQNWSGIAIHTYSYSSMTDIKITGKEVTSNAIGGVPYREGVFNAWNDPAKFGLFYHAALMFRRKDLKQATNSIAIRVEDDMNLMHDNTAALKIISEKHKVGMEFPGQEKTAQKTVKPAEVLVDLKKQEVLSDTEEIYRNWNEKFGWMDSERTKAVYGFIGKQNKISLKGMEVKAKSDFATIAVSSLNDNSIESSDNLLLTAVGRSENTDMKFSDDKTEMIDVGKPPILIENIEAEIKIETNVKNLRVWSINAEGFFAGVIPSDYKDGFLSFEIGKCFKSMYYLIQAE